jgi:predicted nucleotidyltransferase
MWSSTVAEAGDVVSIMRAVLPELKVQWPIRSLALFGSRVRSDATRDSDLDILVEFTRPVALSSFLALEARLASAGSRPGRAPAACLGSPLAQFDKSRRFAGY